MPETPEQRNRRIFEEATSRGEPVFVLRAQDIVAPYVIEKYLVLAAQIAKGDLPMEFTHAIIERLGDFDDWRRFNPELVKFPDVRP